MNLTPQTLFPQDALRALCDERLASLRALLHDGASGHVLSQTLCASLDTHIQTLCGMLEKRLGPLSIHLYATGSYGRQQLCARSDLDLLVLYPNEGVDKEALACWLRTFKSTLHAQGWTVSLPARTPEECEQLALSDLTVASSLLNARPLVSPSPHPSLPQWAQHDLASHIASMLRNIVGGARLAQRLFEAYRQRHPNTPHATYTLEPDLKHDRGGLRDLQFLAWSAHILHGSSLFAPDTLLPATKTHERRALYNATDTLLRVRQALHLQDTPLTLNKLLYTYQPTLSAIFGYHTPTLALPHTHDTPSHTPTERFMRDVYSCMHTVASISTRWQQLWLLSTHDTAPPITIRRGLCVRQDHLDFTRDDDRLDFFDDDAPVPSTHRKTKPEVLFTTEEHTTPINLHPQAKELLERNPIEIFETSLDLQLPIHPIASAYIARSATTLRPASHEALASLKRILTSTSCPAHILEDIHAHKLLQTLLPEFESIYALNTQDPYHTYTVDIHVLIVHKTLKKFFSLPSDSTLEFYTRIAQDVPDYRRPVLLLAALLHDIGKGQPGDHHTTSPKLAASIGQILQLTQREIDHLKTLIKHHFLLTSISQRRDLNDPDTLLSVARSLRSVPTLNDLTLLSAADMIAAGPSNFTPWKDTLLQTLHTRVSDILQRGTEDLWWGEPIRARIAQSLYERPNRPKRLSKTFCETFAHTTTRHYLQTTPFHTLQHHADLIANLQAFQLNLVRFTFDPKQRISQLLVICPSFHGLLASVTGVLTSHGVNILNANVQTTTHALALDLFTLETPKPLPKLRVRALERDLCAVLFDELNVEDRIRAAQSSQLPPKGPNIPTQISVDQELSSTWTILDVITRDRPGVLWTITRTLRTLECDVHLSKISTEGPRVVDVFYIQHRSRHTKLTPQEAQTVVDTLHTALIELEAPNTPPT